MRWFRRTRRGRFDGHPLPPMPEECYPPLSVVLDVRYADRRPHAFVGRAEDEFCAVCECVDTAAWHTAHAARSDAS